jgi:hypothetical protein
MIESDVRTSLELIKGAYLRVPDEVRPKLKLSAFFGEARALLELWKRGFQPEWKSGQFRYDILLPIANNQSKKIEVKSCNTENPLLKKLRARKFIEAGCSGIKPSEFDYLIFVTFNGLLKDLKFYIFSSSEARMFRHGTMWKKDSNKEDKELNIPESERPEIQEIIDNSLNAWQKLPENQ